MDATRFFTLSTARARENDPPGQWIPNVPTDCIRLQAGYPSPDFVPWKQLAQASIHLLEKERDKPLQYLGSPMAKQLKNWVLQRLENRDMEVTDDELLITAGSAQAIDLTARAFLDDSSCVFLESPTYMESLETFQNYTQDIVSVPVDEFGMRTEDLSVLLASRKERSQPMPKFLYTIPTNQNPTGTTMPLERRKHLLRLAKQYDFLILEDDAYGELSFFDGPPTIKALDTDGRVLYLGSLSKVIAPGLRIGWIAADKDVISTMFMLKKDLTHPFGEAIVAQYLSETDWSLHIASRVEQYKRRSEAMLKALKSAMPEQVTWYQPTGGYFVWLRVPGIRTDELLARALENGVAFIAGRHFYLDPTDGDSYLRLSFSYSDLTEIPVAVERLAETIRSY